MKIKEKVRGLVGLFDRSNLVIITSFVLSALLMHGILFSKGFYPFGDKTLLIMDMKGQYVEFFSSLRHVAGDNSMFFSWSRAMGGEYLGLVAYYLASPLSFLTLFFSIEELPAAIYLLTVLKVGLSGMTFAAFLVKAFPRKGAGLLAVVFSLFYALSSYNMVYGMCLMWLDGVILLPLVLLGIERIVEGKGGGTYYLSMAALFLCNYYTSYMVGIFALLYFLVKLVARWDGRRDRKKAIRDAWRRCLSFGMNTVFALLTALPLLLPTILDLAAGKLGQANYRPTDVTTNFPFLSVFGKLLPGRYDTITNTGALPSIYCGFVVAVLALLFFLAKNVNRRERAGHYVLGGILLVSFWSFSLDVAWHGFQYPNWFPYRYAFLTCALLVLMAYRTAVGISWNRWVGTLLPALLFVCAVLELPYNGGRVLDGLDGEFGYGSREEYSSFVSQTLPLVEEARERDDGFYRMEKDYEYSKNDAMLLGYNGMTHYSSTFNEKINAFTRDLGLAQSYVWNSGYGSTELVDALFGVKYKMLKQAPSDSYVPLEKNGSVTLYENSLALPVAFCVDEGARRGALETSYNSFENQDRFLSELMGGETACFSYPELESDVSDQGVRLCYVAQSDHPAYLSMAGDGAAQVYVNGDWVGDYFTSETTCNLYLGSFRKGEPVEIWVQHQGQTYNEVVGELDVDRLADCLSELREGALEVTHHRGGSIRGEVQAREGQCLFTSIPYSRGLRVRVDGKKVEPQSYGETFLIIPLAEGRHEISVSYVSPGFVLGLVLALVGMGGGALWNGRKRIPALGVRKERRK